MEYRQLGTTGVRVSEIAYGTFPLGTYTDTDAGVAMIHAAMDRGVNFIDTANVYFKGRSEEIVGAALKGRRQEVVLASKFGHPMGAGPNERGSSRYHIYREIEDSLRRLQTDYIDVYYFHIPDPTTPLEESIRAMDDLVQQGKVRYIGTSHFAAWQIAHGLRLAERNRLTPWVVEQPRYCLIDRAIEQDVVPMAQAHGIGIVAHSPLGGGFLTGKYKPGQPPPPDSPFRRAPWRHFLVATALRPDDDRTQSQGCGDGADTRASLRHHTQRYRLGVGAGEAVCLIGHYRAQESDATGG